MKDKVMLATFLIFIFFSMPVKAQNFMDKVVSDLGGTVVEKGERIEISNVYDINIGSIEKKVIEYGKNEVELSINDDLLRDEGRIIINISSKDNDFLIDNFAYDILKDVKRKNIDDDVKIFKYMKACLEDDDLEYYKKSLESSLVNLKSGNINFFEMESGIAVTAFGNLKLDSEWEDTSFDINIALMKYTSGTYIIIGTPIITCAY